MKVDVHKFILKFRKQDKLPITYKGDYGGTSEFLYIFIIANRLLYTRGIIAKVL